DAAVVQQDDDRLVALGPVGPHDGLAGPRRGGPIHAPQLVVDRALPELVDLAPAAPALGRTQSDLEDAGPVDAKLRLLPGGERWVDPQESRHQTPPLPG